MPKCDKRTRPDCSEKSVKFWSVTSISVNIVVLLFLLTVSIVHLQRSSTVQVTRTGEVGRSARDTDRYCFKESKESCLERGYEVKQHENWTLCCGDLKNHLHGLMSEELRERLQSDAAEDRVLDSVKGYINQLHVNGSAVDARPAAHVGILTNGGHSGPDAGAPRIQWEKSGEGSFISGGLIHGGDRLTVTKAGYYYVYTGLQYNVDPQTVDTGAVVAYIYRHVNGTRASRRKLMMARESSCKTTRGNVTGPVSVYMAGIFLLRDQDEISVRTHSLSLLNRSPATTYMGMHMV